jgi:hypothetical protein
MGGNDRFAGNGPDDVDADWQRMKPQFEDAPGAGATWHVPSCFESGRERQEQGPELLDAV